MDRHDLVQLIRDTFTEQGLDPNFALAICEHESGLHPQARSPASASDEKYGGAWGLCQILLATAKDFGYTGDGPGLWDPALNLQFFAALTRRNIAAWKTTDVSDLICLHNSGKPLYKAPESTRTVYLPTVLKLYQKWRNSGADPITGG